MTYNKFLFLLWLLVSIVIIVLLWLARTPLIPFFVGAILAYSLEPLIKKSTDLLTKIKFGSIYIKKIVSIFFIYGLLGVMISLFIIIVGDGIANQFKQFTNELPVLTEKARIEFINLLNQYRNQVPIETQLQIDNYLSDLSTTFADFFANFSKNLISYLTNTIAIILGFLVVPFWMFYVLRDGTLRKKNITSTFPEFMHNDINFILSKFEKIFGNYLRGQFLLALVVGTAIVISLTIINLPMSFALGVIGGVTELIPVIGPWIALIPALLIVLSFDPSLTIPVLFIYFTIQMIENLILVPKVHSDTIDVQPAVIVILLIVAGYLFGFFGLLIILPTYAFIKEILIYINNRLTKQSNESTK
ncbi:MAG: hypothetical protein CL872_07060 [Dehalococcoidaceae bacterium]|nr:hypothetical protein [Dehalococcoidaceae bacterium]